MTASGTHLGRLDTDVRKRRSAKNARNASRRGQDVTKPCATYAECNHRKHGYRPRKVRGDSTRNRTLVWPLGGSQWK